MRPIHPRLPGFNRRRVLAGLAGIAGSAACAEALFAAAAERGKVTKGMVSDAARLFGLDLTPKDRDRLLEGLQEALDSFASMRKVSLDNSVPPAFRHDPEPYAPKAPAVRRGLDAPVSVQVLTGGAKPGSLDDVAFAPVSRLAGWIAGRDLSSVELTRLSLERLRKYDPLLKCVVTLTEERALAAAERADAELAAGRYRGPLHGIPWGAKDLMAVKGYPTTWGTPPLKDQVIDQDATVVQRLDEAGAVLVAKMSVGELAWGDVWTGGMTRNPWQPEKGSSGSSAGSASATAAGLVPFALGTETWGSIVSPTRRCGVTGLRPSFGRISRHGIMALAWTMDKVGPIARAARDCGWVMQAILGPDGQDVSVVDRPFDPEPDLDPRALRLGYVKALFEEKPEEDQAESHALDLATLEALRGLGFEPVPIELPAIPVEPLAILLGAEAAAAFDEFTRRGLVDQMVRQEKNSWPVVFRESRFVPAVEYIQANRIRTLLMREMAKVMEQVDVYVAPAFGGNDLLATNLTGHPAILVPNGFRKDGTPSGITFTGQLYGEGALLAVARRYQEAAGFMARRPELREGS
jgi:Asp-tRNA(Asn)/Glu-tRNA(Gln) amidotransferase A subunit family amidase